MWEVIVYSEKAIEVYRRLPQDKDTKVNLFSNKIQSFFQKNKNAKDQAVLG